MPGIFRSKTFYALAVAGLATLVLLGLTRAERPAVTHVESWLSDALSPLQGATTWVTERFSGSVNALAEIGRLRDENSQLREALAQQPGLQAQIGELKAENGQLRQQLGLAQRSPLHYLSASVIGRSTDNWFDTITINRGTSSGLTRDMAVVTEQGLVGRIFRVTDRTATVMLITDRDSGVGALVAESRDVGVLQGQGQSGLKMQFFNPNAQVSEGDSILTSGLNSVFPKGIPIGRVMQVTGANLSKQAVIQPAVDFQHLERVLVVISAPPDGMGLPPLPVTPQTGTAQPGGNPGTQTPAQPGSGTTVTPPAGGATAPQPGAGATQPGTGTTQPGTGTTQPGTGATQPGTGTTTPTPTPPPSGGTAPTTPTTPPTTGGTTP